LRIESGSELQRWSEGSMKTMEEILKTPTLELTEEEIARLDPKTQAWARHCRDQYAREQACPGHERESLGDTRSGWHPGRCKHCGMDMSYDSRD